MPHSPKRHSIHRGAGAEAESCQEWFYLEPSQVGDMIQDCLWSTVHKIVLDTDSRIVILLLLEAEAAEAH